LPIKSVDAALSGFDLKITLKRQLGSVGFGHRTLAPPARCGWDEAV
jgi:hypothetical protein